MKGLQASTAKATTCSATACSSRTWPASAAKWLRRSAAHLRRRRKRCARLRHPLRRRPTPSSRTRCNFNLTNPDGSHGPARSHQPDAGQRADSAAHLPPGLHRRRHQHHRQRRVPHPDRQPGHLRLLHRLRHDLQRCRPRSCGRACCGLSSVNSPLYGCPNFVNGACFGGQSGHLPARTSRPCRARTSCRACPTAPSCR